MVTKKASAMRQVQALTKKHLLELSRNKCTLCMTILTPIIFFLTYIPFSTLPITPFPNFTIEKLKKPQYLPAKLDPLTNEWSYGFRESVKDQDEFRNFFTFMNYTNVMEKDRVTGERRRGYNPMLDTMGPTNYLPMHCYSSVDHKYESRMIGYVKSGNVYEEDLLAQVKMIFLDQQRVMKMMAQMEKFQSSVDFGADSSSTESSETADSQELDMSSGNEFVPDPALVAAGGGMAPQDFVMGPDQLYKFGAFEFREFESKQAIDEYVSQADYGWNPAKPGLCLGFQVHENSASDYELEIFTRSDRPASYMATPSLDEDPARLSSNMHIQGFMKYNMSGLNMLAQFLATTLLKRKADNDAQIVNFTAPAPIDPITINVFNLTFIGWMPIYIFVGFLPLVIGISSQIMIEKDNGFRQKMQKNLSVSNHVYLLSWICAVSILNFFISMPIAVILKFGVIPGASFGMLFLLFWLFIAGLFSMIWTVQALSKSARTSFALLIFFYVQGIFNTYAVDQIPIFVPAGLKVLACLNPLSAMLLTMNLVGKLSAMKLQFEEVNMNLEKENFSLTTGLVMLALDLIIYTSIGFVLDYVQSRKQGLIVANNSDKTLNTVQPEKLESDQSSIKHMNEQEFSDTEKISESVETMSFKEVHIPSKGEQRVSFDVSKGKLCVLAGNQQILMAIQSYLQINTSQKSFILCKNLTPQENINLFTQLVGENTLAEKLEILCCKLFPHTKIVQQMTQNERQILQTLMALVEANQHKIILLSDPQQGCSDLQFETMITFFKEYAKEKTLIINSNDSRLICDNQIQLFWFTLEGKLIKETDFDHLIEIELQNRQISGQVLELIQNQVTLVQYELMGQQQDSILFKYKENQNNQIHQEFFDALDDLRDSGKVLNIEIKSMPQGLWDQMLQADQQNDIDLVEQVTLTPHKEEITLPKKQSLNSDTNQHSIDDQDDITMEKTVRPLKKSLSDLDQNHEGMSKSQLLHQKTKEFLDLHIRFNPNKIVLFVLPSLIFILGSLFSHFQYQSTPNSRQIDPNWLPFKQEVLVNQDPFFGDLTTDQLMGAMPSAEEAFNFNKVDASEDPTYFTFLNRTYEFGKNNVTSLSHQYGSYLLYNMSKADHHYFYVNIVNVTSPHTAALFPNFMLESILRNALDQPKFNFKVRITPIELTQAGKKLFYTTEQKVKLLPAMTNGAILGAYLNQATELLIAYAACLILILFLVLTSLMQTKRENLKNFKMTQKTDGALFWMTRFMHDLCVFLPLQVAIIILMLIFERHSIAGLLSLLIAPFELLPYTYLFSLVFVRQSSAQLALSFFFFFQFSFMVFRFLQFRQVGPSEEIGDAMTGYLRLFPTHSITQPVIQNSKVLDLMRKFRIVNEEGTGEEINDDEFALQNGSADLIFTILHSLFAWTLLLSIELINKRCSLIAQKAQKGSIQVTNSEIVDQKEDNRAEIVPELLEIDEKRTKRVQGSFLVQQENVQDRNAASKCDDLIHIDNLSFTRGEKRGCQKQKILVKDLSLSIRKGQSVAFVRSDTLTRQALLKIIASRPSMMNVTAGRVLYKSSNLNFTYCGQNFSTTQNTTLDQLIKSQIIEDQEPSVCLIDIIVELDLEKQLDTHVQELSKLEQKLVQIALVLSLKSQVIVLEEPFEGLTPRLNKVISQIISHRQKNASIIVSAHSKFDLRYLNLNKTVCLDINW